MVASVLRRLAALPAAALSAALLSTSALVAQCQFPADLAAPAGDVAAETARLRRVLDACERPRLAGEEEVLFTWGHRRKVRWLLEEAPLESCAYNREREAVRNRYAPTGAHLEVDEAVLWLAGRILASPESRDLWTLRHYPWQELFPAVPPRRVTWARDIAMIERTYPGFLEALETDPEDRLDDLEDRLDEAEDHREAMAESERLHDEIGARLRRLEEEALGPAQVTALEAEIADRRAALEDVEETLRETRGLHGLEDARARGELVGLDIVVEGGTFASSSSWGYGVYLATDPLAFIEHFSTPDHAGLVCDFSGGRAPGLEVVDWTHLEDLQALRRYPTQGEEGLSLGVLVPPGQGLGVVGGYNNYIHPAAFDRASHARLLAIRRDLNTVIWVDRCAIDYRAPACRELRVTDLTCEEAERLSALPAQVAMMEDYFQRTDPEGVFLGQLNTRCGLELELY